MTDPRVAGPRTDADLVLCARDGDKAAFAELVRRHGDTAARLARRMLGDPDLARDASQEAILSALVSLDRLRTPDRFGPWLCGIALNVARRWLGARRECGPLAGIDPVDPDPGPDAQAEAAEMARRVRLAVAGLAPGQRDAVLLFYLQGLTHREVALELGISVGAVKARLHQARAVLSTQLRSEREERRMTTTRPGSTAEEWVDATIADLRAGDGEPSRRMYVVFLAESGGDRQVPIWIGQAEAVALALRTEGDEMPPRPMVYQFTASLLDATGARVTEVRVTRLAAGIFYATVVVEGTEGRREVDARPSDALNIATVSGAPIRVHRDVFAEVGNPPEPAADREDKLPTSAAELAGEFREHMQRTPRMRDQER